VPRSVVVAAFATTAIALTATAALTVT